MIYIHAGQAGAITIHDIRRTGNKWKPLNSFNLHSKVDTYKQIYVCRYILYNYICICIYI